MKIVKTVFALAIAVFFAGNLLASPATNCEKKTAESVFAFAKEMKKFDEKAFKAEVNELSFGQKVKLVNLAIQDVKLCAVQGNATIGEYSLAVLLPPVAVGLHTDWAAVPTLSNCAWTLLWWLPGIVHAIYILER